MPHYTLITQRSQAVAPCPDIAHLSDELVDAADYASVHGNESELHRDFVYQGL